MTPTADDELPEWGGPEPAGRPLLDERDRPPRRPRWRDVGVVGAGLLAVVLAISLLAGGDGDRAATAPTTTSTTAPGRLAGASPSTSLGGDQVVLGPLLPQATGGTVLALLEEGGDVAIVEVDTGVVRRLKRLAVRDVWAVVGIRYGVLLAEPFGFITLGLDGGVRWRRPDMSGQPAASVAGTEVWAMDDRSQQLVALGVDGSVGQRIDVPQTSGPMVVLEPGVVVPLHGSLVLVDTDGTRRLVGYGVAVAGAGRSVLRVTCEADLVCPLHATDVVTGADRVIETPPGTIADGAFWGNVASPDGRHTVIRLAARPPRPGPMAVVDVVSGRLVTVPDTEQVFTSPAFSADGAWLFFLAGGDRPLRAFHLPTGELVHLPVEILPRPSDAAGVARIPG